MEPTGDDGAHTRDVQLMAGVRAGQADALQQLYHCYFSRGYALAWRILTDKSAAEDCVQDAFLKLWERPQMFNPERGLFIHWFLTVIHHSAVSQVRKQQRLQSFPDAAEGWSMHEGPDELGDRLPGESSVEDRLAQMEIQRVMRAALSGLKNDQRKVLELAYFGGMSQTQIADHLQLPLGTVKTRIRTGMLILRAKLGEVDPAARSQQRTLVSA